MTLSTSSTESDQSTQGDEGAAARVAAAQHAQGLAGVTDGSECLDEGLVPGREVKIAVEFLRAFFGNAYREEFAIHLWNGVTLPAFRRARFTLGIAQPYALRAAFTPPLDLSPGRAVANGLLEISGDVEAAIDTLDGAIAGLPRRKLPALIALILRMPAPPKLPD